MLIGYAMGGRRTGPLRGAAAAAPLITGIGVSIILQHLAMLILEPQPARLSADHRWAFPPLCRGHHHQRADRPFCRSRSRLMAGLAALVYRTRLGTAMRATAHNPRLRGSWIDANRIIALTFVIGAGRSPRGGSHGGEAITASPTTAMGFDSWA